MGCPDELGRALAKRLPFQDHLVLDNSLENPL
jgi:hypothetical protein